jgi:Domain of unknown function (DUF4386)
LGWHASASHRELTTKQDVAQGGGRAGQELRPMRRLSALGYRWVLRLLATASQGFDDERNRLEADVVRVRAYLWGTHMTTEFSVQRLARTIGLLILLSAVFGGVGESYIPAKIIVSGDAAATALNITTHPLLFRLGFASYLVEGVCDVALALLFYRLLRPAGKNLALFAAFLGLISTAMYAVAEAFYFAPTLILSGADFLKTFSPEQLKTLALLSLGLFGRIAGIFLGFYGLASFIRGLLMYRSGYLPRIFGVLFMIAGAGFIAVNLATVLAPAYASGYLLLPIGIAGPSLMLWLLVKGVDVPKWNARLAASG